MNSPIQVPPGWWLEPAPNTSHLYVQRLDGMVRAQSAGPIVDDPQSGSSLVVGFIARAPRSYTTQVRMVEGDTLEEVCALADRAWPPLETAPEPVEGMTAWHDRATYLITSVVRSRTSTYPSLSGQDVYRFVLVPFDGINDRRPTRAFATEIPVDAWPRTFLIIDPRTSG